MRAFKSAREHLQASVACLRGLFTVEGARTIDYCVRLDVTGSVVEANNQITRISRVAREGFPKSIQAALDSVGARTEIVEIREAKRLDLRFFGGPGLQGVAVLVRLDTGDLETRTGSWDGAPPWSDRDLDTGHVIELSEKLAIVRAVRDKKEHATAVVHLSRGRFDELAPGPEDLVLAPGELLALAIIQDLSRGTRAREFSAVGLGTYTRSNPYIHCLRDLGLVEIKDSVATTTSAGRRRAAAIDRVAVQREFEAVR